jgi:hypothetical protein
VPQSLIEEVDDSRVAFHDRAPAMGVGAARCVAQALIITIKSWPAIGGALTVEDSNRHDRREVQSRFWAPAQRDVAAASASSMMRRMVRAQRPHWALQPRQ